MTRNNDSINVILLREINIGRLRNSLKSETRTIEVDDVEDNTRDVHTTI